MKSFKIINALLLTLCAHLTIRSASSANTGADADNALLQACMVGGGEDMFIDVVKEAIEDVSESTLMIVCE